ncbi:bifunctional phosphopantothenoylcysteine decarboxylase/phosphopantothenate--cysteine ligase CoaBC [Pantoea sp. Aalb]|uniref:bifunctional phosphopantothenoylcysteine decarboxylase/phosphopantothenate--cysteine ligase CoaBC n=1 Tax=Pantoea sp. Aalb TaxID=2576762 RepID=UPI001323693A|nr:bifunctional phosphopantothenoylcysteine decarboxylase/phosphopantothenate--cysteine ligase CoaBC [Pantoea sp. Aalb]MXP67947.1 bifunctional phosphopantothenoylcysteine decarboxylase/phosphopantothenate--cysteine ligase CoaBC [Pantoea sp. Aalb]
MTKLVGKKILLGISGSIAAYKVPELVRMLQNYGAKVRVMMTEAAKFFITPLSLQVVSGHPVFDDLFNPVLKNTINHIKLAKWPDLIIIVPATANLIANIALGMSNDLLTTVCLASDKPIAIVPAINQQMYSAAITQENLQRLYQRGMLIWGPDIGRQACGDIGPGRMINLITILVYVVKWASSIKDLQHLNIMITAGPTHEALDPVRYISNYSSGKMGFAIATAAAQRGAQVTLITGPVTLPTPLGIKRIDINSALEMEAAVMKQIKKQHIFIASAAVADYRGANIAFKKIKKNDDHITLKLIKNPDIVAKVASMQKKRPFVVGFAAETHDIEKYAQRKRKQKNLDLICANIIAQKKQGFNSDTNILYLFGQDGNKILPLNNKKLLGQQLIDEIIIRYDKKGQYKNS